tara:strand:+ start:1618 stop:2688 length:1071 start_codon:yes stop_codon:yes gene_type:complete
MKINILGDSLVSLTLAKTLVNEGIFVDLIYDKKVKLINKNRTIGMTKSNVLFFNQYILNISKLLWDIENIEIYLEKFSKEKILSFKSSKKQLFSIIKNYELYNFLNNSLKKNKFFKKKKLINKSIENNSEIIINCDPNNYITKKIFYKKTKKNYQSISFVTKIKHKKIIQNNIAYQVFTKFGPIAFLPISKSETSIVYSVKKNFNLNKIDIMNLIRKYNPKYLITRIEKIESFELFSSNLRNYYYKNIMAFGDLLHRIHPLAGQGFNMTVRDIRQLRHIIMERLNLGLEIDTSIFLNFEKHQKHKNFLFSSGIDLIYEFFDLESKIQNEKLGKLVQVLGKNKPLNNLFRKIADSGI